MSEETEVSVIETPVTPVVESNSAWYGEGLSDEQVGFIQNKGWEGAKGMLESYTSLEKLKGASADELIKIPGHEDIDGWKDVHKRLGMPDTAEDYVFNKHEGEEFTDEETKWFRETFHKRGLSSSDATELFDEFVARAESLGKAEDEATQEAQDASIGDLQKRWGAKYEERVELANRVLRQSGIDQEEIDAVRETLGHTKTIEVFAKLGERIGGDKILQGGDGESQFGKTVEQYKADLAKLNSEIGADGNRLALAAEGKGPDVTRRKQLRDIINSMG